MDKQSQDRLATCDHHLQMIFAIVDQYIPCRITEGHRGQVEQDAAYQRYLNGEKGGSKVQWPNGKHNSMPSKAVDAIPLPVDYNDTKKLHFFAGFVMAVAALHGVSLRWGGDWDGDKILGEPNDDWDKPHFEIKL